MAPSTPPPPSSVRLAALTMAATSSVVMSATHTSSRVVPTSALSRGGAVMRAILAQLRAPRTHPTALPLLHQLGFDRLGHVDRAGAPDSVEMRVEEAAGRALAELAQHLEIFVVGLECAARADVLGQLLHDDAMQPQPAEFALPRAAWQAPLVDQ